METLLLGFIASVIALVHGGNLTVTHEAWFDIEIRDFDGPGEDYRGRFTIGLFGIAAPVCTLNFAKIASGYERKPPGGRKLKLSYKNTDFHRVVSDFVIQGGDITNGDGTGGRSIFANVFDDEPFVLSHRAAGYVSMANHGPDTNGSQFFVMLTKARWLDKKHVVFGKVVKGMDTVRAMGEVETDDNARPKSRVRIIDCGSEEVAKRYTLTEEESLSEEDLDRD